MSDLTSIVDDLLRSFDDEKYVAQDTLRDTENGISLLALKNESLLAYISNLLLVAASQLSRNAAVFGGARQRAIEQRVTLEKGVKGLETKIAYQIDKALRSFRRQQELDEQKQDRSSEGDDRKDRNSEEKVRKGHSDLEGEESEEESDSDVDVTAFRPNLASLGKSGGRSAPRGDDSSRDDAREYVAPKISSTMPAFEREKAAAAKPRRRDFAMEEYIRESGDAPTAEPSIGSQIMDFGRGGERTERERRKEKEVRDYEESNFTRIGQTSSKRARKDASQRQRDATTKSFFGEDWGFLDQKGGKKRKVRR